VKNYTSDFIFLLAEKYQISLDSNPTVFLDENYIGFCREYIEQSKIRDKYLKEYLRNNPNLFRTFLPWRPYIFGTVFQLQWYYDEIIVYDPIFFEITHFKSGQIEKDKQNLRGVLGYLNRLKDNINEGFLLFGSYDAFSTDPKIIDDNKFETLLSIPELREECDRLVEVYKMQSEEGKQKEYFNIRCFYRNKQNFFTVYKDVEKLKDENGYGITFDLVGSEYTRITLEDIKAGDFYDRAFDSFKEDYPFEIKEILNYVDIGSTIKTPVLFNNRLDELVLSNISNHDKIIKSKANDYYKLILPFVDGIPPERLYDLRTNMPSSFIDFRNTLFEIIYDFEKSGIEKEVLELKIKQKVNPIINKLDSEIKNSITKAKIIGVGSAIVGSIGSLGLWHFGIDASKYASLLLSSASLTHQASVIANYLTENNTAKSNSLYYLWKVQKEK
jgi:hypothetical protein